MTNKYLELKERHTKEFNAFPMMFAFDRKQFEEGMKSLGLEPNDTDKIYSLGMGGYYKKSDSKEFKELLDRHIRERADAIAEDETGEGFIFQMFHYELNNHEYIVTYDTEDTLDALGLTIAQVRADKRLSNGLQLAVRQVLKDYREQEAM